MREQSSSCCGSGFSLFFISTSLDVLIHEQMLRRRRRIMRRRMPCGAVCHILKAPTLQI